MTIMMAGLTHQMQEAGTKPIIPSGFVRSFITFANTMNEDIQPGAQADSAEAIQILLDGLHMQLSRQVKMVLVGKPNRPDKQELIASMKSWGTYFVKEWSPLVDAFYGQTQTRVICDSCKMTTTRYEPWSVLKVPIAGVEGGPIPTLEECIRAAMATDTLEDYTCDGCKKKGTAKMEHAISRFPTNLILSIKRFTNSGKKIIARITYDADKVDLSEWRAWTSLQEKAETMYRVTSTIDHMGTMGGGHYVARARYPDGWFIFDDWNVMPSPIGGDATPHTYILFMEKSA